MAARIFNAIAMAIGGLALWWMIRNIGVDELVDRMRDVGYWAIPIVALDVIAMSCDAFALRAFAQCEDRIPYWRVWGAQAGGRAINVLTPGGMLGEPVKLGLLDGYASRSRILSSIVLLDLAHAYIMIGTILVGTPIAFLLVDLDASTRTLVLIGVGLLIAGAVALGYLVHHGAATTFAKTLRRLRIISKARAAKWVESLEEVDKHVRELHHPKSSSTRQGIAYVVASHLLTWVSTGILLGAVGAQFSPKLVIGILSIGAIIKTIAGIVPMGLGVADGGNYGLYELLGSTGPVGMAMTMLDRARSLAVAAIGLVALAVMQITKRKSPPKP